MGRKLAFFGDGHQFRDERHGRRVWVVPILSGEFIIDRRFGYRDGLMGGNLWFLGATADAALEAAERAAAAAAATPGVILPFPGGVAASGSKAGSRYSFSIASTYAEFCPTLRDKLGPSLARAAGRRLDSGNHHQRPRPARRSSPPRGPPSRRPSTRPAWRRFRPATTAGGWARVLFICVRKSSRPRNLWRFRFSQAAECRHNEYQLAAGSMSMFASTLNMPLKAFDEAPTKKVFIEKKGVKG